MLRYLVVAPKRRLLAGLFGVTSVSVLVYDVSSLTVSAVIYIGSSTQGLGSCVGALTLEPRHLACGTLLVT